MDLFEAIRERRSVRAFLPEPLDPESVRSILEACNQAPSAGNLQAYEIYRVEDAGVREALAAAAYDQQFVEEAPLALSASVGVAERGAHANLEALIRDADRWMYRAKEAGRGCVCCSTVAEPGPA